MGENNKGNIETTISPEGNPKASFSKEAQEQLKNGWIIIPLNEGEQLKFDNQEQTNTWNSWTEKWPDPDALSKHFSHVAIRPEFLMPDSANKFPNEQREMLSQQNKDNENKGFREVEGLAIDYARIGSVFFAQTGKDLFNGRYTGTKTRFDGSRIYVGGVGASRKSMEPNSKSSDTGLAAIAVPFNPSPNPNSR